MVALRVTAGDMGARMALAEGGELLFALKQRGQGVVALRAVERLDGVEALGEQRRLAGLMRRAEGDVVQRILRADTGEAERLVKAGAQLAHERQRAAEVDDVALDGTALRQTADGLVDDGHEDGAGDVRAPGSLIEQRLHVRLGEHAAAGGDGVGALGVFGLLVHLRGGDAQQRGHLVDERAGAARAGAVHAHLERSLEEEDLGVLAAQLDDDVRARHEQVRGHLRRVDLLHERDVRAQRQAHAR